MTPRYLFVMTALLLVAGCSGPEDAERCADLEDWFEGVERELQRDCAVDTDCAVVYVRPDHPVAASQTPDPVGFDRARDEFVSTCGGFGTLTGSVVAVCEPVLEDRISADGTEVEVELGRTCVLRGDFDVDDDEGDVGLDGGPDIEEPPCGCASDADCPDGRCAACACYPATLCGNACAGAAVCEASDALGVGATADACVLGCEAALAREPEYQTWATCLAEASCDVIDECRVGLP